jgi:hypothetical protein
VLHVADQLHMHGESITTETLLSTAVVLNSLHLSAFAIIKGIFQQKVHRHIEMERRYAQCFNMPVRCSAAIALHPANT